MKTLRGRLEDAKELESKVKGWGNFYKTKIRSANEEDPVSLEIFFNDKAVATVKFNEDRAAKLEIDGLPHTYKSLLSIYLTNQGYRIKYE